MSEAAVKTGVEGRRRVEVAAEAEVGRQDSLEVNKDILDALSTFIEEEEAREPAAEQSSAAVKREATWAGSARKTRARVGKRRGSNSREAAGDVGSMATVRGNTSSTPVVVPALALSAVSGADEQLPFDIPNLAIPISARITASTYVKGTRDAKLRQDLLQMSHDQLLDHVMFMQWQAENKDKLISKYRQQVETLQEELREVCRRTGAKSSYQARDAPTVHLLDEDGESDSDEEEDEDKTEEGAPPAVDGAAAATSVDKREIAVLDVDEEEEEEEAELDIDKQLDDFIDAHESAIVASSSEFSINLSSSGGTSPAPAVPTPAAAVAARTPPARKASDLWHMPVDSKSPALLGRKSESGPLAALVEETVGYYVEDGVRAVEIRQHFALQNCTFYQEDFFSRPHENLMAKETAVGPVIASISKDGSSKHRVLLRTRRGDEQHIVEKANVAKLTWRSLSHKVLKAAAPELGSCKWTSVANPNLNLELIEFENRTVVKQFKIGALLAHAGQRKEEEMFANQGGHPLWEEFLAFLGDRVELKGWAHFGAGLDTKRDTTGTHSVYTQWHSNEVMFHVSTLLPYSASDPQQVERKRHIGNDIVMLVFLTGDTPYKPTTISSNFIHVTLVVRPHEISADGTSASSYRLEVVAKDSVEPFGPALPERPVFARGAKFHDFLIAKMINAELSCYRSEKFVKKLQHARETYLRTIMTAYLK